MGSIRFCSFTFLVPSVLCSSDLANLFCPDIPFPPGFASGPGGRAISPHYCQTPLAHLPLPSSLFFRKQKYFYKGGLVWDENSSDGRYVKENCKPLKVSFWLPPAQLMPRRHPRLLGAGFLQASLANPNRVAMM